MSSETVPIAVRVQLRTERDTWCGACVPGAPGFGRLDANTPGEAIASVINNLQKFIRSEDELKAFLKQIGPESEWEKKLPKKHSLRRELVNFELEV